MCLNTYLYLKFGLRNERHIENHIAIYFDVFINVLFN